MEPTATLPQSQFNAIEGTERATSSLSIAASLFVIGSYLGSDLFQTPINRLVFLASWGNILANVGIMVGREGLVRIPESYSLCIFQGFFIQWFVGADALWVFCMAFNVYLTLFCRYSAHDLRRLEWRYFVLCYGLPFIPAVVFLIISSVSRVKIYGKATMWCWIAPEYPGFRFGLFYGPVWLVILLTFGILLYAAKEIIASRKRVKRISTSRSREAEGTSSSLTPPDLTMPPAIDINETPTFVNGSDAEGNVGARPSPEDVVAPGDLQEMTQPEPPASAGANPTPPTVNVSGAEKNVGARQSLVPPIPPAPLAGHQETVQLEPPTAANADFIQPAVNDPNVEGNLRSRQSPEDVSPIPSVASAERQETAQSEPPTSASADLIQPAVNSSNAEGNLGSKQRPREVPPIPSVAFTDLQDTVQPEPRAVQQCTPQTDQQQEPQSGSDQPDLSPESDLEANEYFDTNGNLFKPAAVRRHPSYDFQPLNWPGTLSVQSHSRQSSIRSVEPHSRQSSILSVEPNSRQNSIGSGGTVRRRRSLERNTAAYQYSKRAILFFIGLLITWTPSSAHRLWILTHPGRPHFVLSYLSGLVLPLQGFWNFSIYVATSSDAVKALWVTTVSTIRRRIFGQDVEKRRAGWEVVMQRARRTKREMNLAAQDDVEQQATTTRAEMRCGSQDSHDNIWGAKRLGRWWHWPTARDSSRGMRWKRSRFGNRRARATFPVTAGVGAGAGTETGATPGPNAATGPSPHPISAPSRTKYETRPASSDAAFASIHGPGPDTEPERGRPRSASHAVGSLPVPASASTSTGATGSGDGGIGRESNI